MRVALVTDGIWPYVLGGMQKHSYYICKYLARAGVQVDLFHFNQSAYDINALEFFSNEERQNINSVVLQFPPEGKLPGHYIRRSKVYAKQVFELIRPRLQQYDFIFTKGFTGWTLLEEKHAGRVKCAPVSINLHGYEMFQRAPDLKTRLQLLLLLRRPAKRLTMIADAVFSYGAGITDIIRKLGVPQNRIIEMPSGIEASGLTDHASPANEKVKFLFIGRYERRKGIEELNEALTILANTGRKNFKMHFIGPIPSDKQLDAGHVKYHGEIRDSNAMRKIVSACDVLLCPSWSEGMPNVILEAMAQGLAVVATDTGAVRVLVNDETGWLLEKPEPAVLSGLIADISSAKPGDLLLKKSAALAHIRRNFVWDHLAGRLIDVCKNYR